MQPNVWVYILQCADGSYYVGKYQGQTLENWVAEHNAATYPDAYTARRRPVRLIWSAWFTRFDDAVCFERQVKGWSRAKKEALMRDDEAALKAFSARGFRPSRAFALRDAPAVAVAPQGEGSLVACASLLPEEARSAVPKGVLRDAPAGAIAPQVENFPQAYSKPLHSEERRSRVTKSEGTFSRHEQK